MYLLISAQLSHVITFRAVTRLKPTHILTTRKCKQKVHLSVSSINTFSVGQEMYE